MLIHILSTKYSINKATVLRFEFIYKKGFQNHSILSDSNKPYPN